MILIFQIKGHRFNIHDIQYVENIFSIQTNRYLIAIEHRLSTENQANHSF